MRTWGCNVLASVATYLKGKFDMPVGAGHPLGRTLHPHIARGSPGVSAAVGGASIAAGRGRWSGDVARGTCGALTWHCLAAHAGDRGASGVRNGTQKAHCVFRCSPLDPRSVVRVRDLTGLQLLRCARAFVSTRMRCTDFCSHRSQQTRQYIGPSGCHTTLISASLEISSATEICEV